MEIGIVDANKYRGGTAATVERHIAANAVDHAAETAGWTGENQVARLLQRNHEWLNLNPFTVLGLATAANEARWRAGAASVLSEAVGAADARSASSGSG